MPSLRFLVLFLIFAATNPVHAEIDNSVDIFFPKSLKHLQYVQTEFPAFWWNFAIIEPTAENADFEKAQQICTLLKKYTQTKIKRLICADELGGFVDTLKEWSADIVLREKFDGSSEKYLNRIAESLTEFSFFSSDKKDFYDLKRNDPLDQWQIYLKKSQTMTPAKFERQRGFLLDPTSKKIIIPLQFLVPPKMESVLTLMDELQAIDGVFLVGPHSSAFTNEKQVHADLAVVSVVGAIVFGLFILFLVLKGRLGALLLFPPVAVALTLAAWVTQLAYGSIHGLTLAFGSGIVGLAVDYGLHGAMNSESPQTWKSNMVGFLTTLVGLAVLTFSGIPLIRQMMFFALFGILFGFIAFFLLCKYLPKYFTIKSIDLIIPDFKYSWVIILILILGGIAGSFNVDLSFDLRRFNYQTTKEAEASNWFFSQGSNAETFLLVHDKKDINKISDEYLWSVKNKIKYVGLGDYLPDYLSQAENLKSWSLDGCPYFKKNLSTAEKKVFAPFLESICEKSHSALTFEDMQKRDYLSSFTGRNQFVSLFLVKDSTEEQFVSERFPQAKSLMASVRGFSDSLKEDFKWMLPAALALSTLILYFYYKNLFYVFASYIPFMSGLGLFFLAKFIFGGGLDLISVLGLLMVFGFSIDYGVFVTDIYVFPQQKDDSKVIYSVLGLAALTNIIGFFPLMFAKHPILHQLGFALFYGTIGTFLGAIWGVRKFLGTRTQGLAKA